MKAIGFKSTTDLVKYLLENNKKARNSDSFLYVLVCKRVNPLVAGLPFETVMANRKQFGIPGFETIRRTRQKIQQHNPELAADAEVEAGRMVREDEFRKFARKVSV